jgi:hypothetical protein
MNKILAVGILLLSVRFIRGKVFQLQERNEQLELERVMWENKLNEVKRSETKWNESWMKWKNL